MPVLTNFSRGTRRKSPISKKNFIENLTINKKEKTFKPSIMLSKPSNSEKIYNIAIMTSPNEKCPEKITYKMLINELDCEDLRSRVKNPHSSDEKEELKEKLWKAYVNVNLHIFSNDTHQQLHRTHISDRSMIPIKVNLYDKHTNVVDF